MLIRQNASAFIRLWDNAAYIENQVNHISRSYMGWQSDIVHLLSRKPQDLNPLIKTIEQSESLILDFINELNRLWFVVIGESSAELEKGDRYYSYGDIDEVEKLFSISDHQPSIVDCRERPWLKTMQIEITSLCNERCIHCYIPNDTKNAGRMFSTARLYSLIDQFAEANGLRIIFSGGEPFLHKDFFEILKYCRKKDLMIFIQSNITTLDDDSISLLRSLNVFNIQVSLYSMSESIHDKITQKKGSWEKTKYNLEKLVANDIPVMISSPIMRLNYEGYVDLLNYSRSLGVFCYIDFILLAQHDFGKDNLKLRLTVEETEELLDVMLRNNRDFFTKIQGINTEKELNTFPFAQRFLKCDIMRNSLCVSVDGKAYPCPAWQGMVVGDCFNQKLLSIWLNNPKVVELRNVNKDSFYKCKSCNLINYCEMCPVYNYNENGGNMYEPCERFCESAALLKKKVKQLYSTIHDIAKHGG